MNETTDEESPFSWSYSDFEVVDPKEPVDYVIAAFAVVGIILNVFVIVQNRYMSRHNPKGYMYIYRYFFVNAGSLSSVVFLLLCYIIRYVTPNQNISNAVACKVLSATELMFQSVMIYTLSALSVDRYCIVKMVIREKSFIARHRYLVMIVILCFSLLLTVPVLVEAHIEDVCVFLDYFSDFAKIYQLTRACVTYVIPLIVITCLYSTMAYILFKSRTNETVKSVTNYKSQLAARSRLGFSVLVITILFAVCYLPNTLYHVLYQFSFDNTMAKHAANWLEKFQNMFVLTYACVHPLVLFATNRTYRRFARSFLRCRFHDMVRDRQNFTGNTMTTEAGRMLGGKRTISTGGEKFKVIEVHSPHKSELSMV